MRRLLDAGVDRLLVWGGDGTVRRCIDTIVADNAKAEVAILPAGTANLLATALGYRTTSAEQSTLHCTACRTRSTSVSSTARRSP